MVTTSLDILTDCTNTFTKCVFCTQSIFVLDFTMGIPLAGAMGVALFGTSLNYWRYPLVKSYRRTIDIVVAFISVPYHIYLSSKTTNKLLCMGPLVFGSAMYPVSILSCKYKYFGTGAFCHCFLHLSVIAGVSFTYWDLQ